MILIARTKYLVFCCSFLLFFSKAAFAQSGISLENPNGMASAFPTPIKYNYDCSKLFEWHKKGRFLGENPFDREMVSSLEFVALTHAIITNSQDIECARSERLDFSAIRLTSTSNGNCLFEYCETYFIRRVSLSPKMKRLYPDNGSEILYKASNFGHTVGDFDVCTFGDRDCEIRSRSPLVSSTSVGIDPAPTYADKESLCDESYEYTNSCAELVDRTIYNHGVYGNNSKSATYKIRTYLNNTMLIYIDRFRIRK